MLNAVERALESSEAMRLKRMLPREAGREPALLKGETGGKGDGLSGDDTKPLDDSERGGRGWGDSKVGSEVVVGLADGLPEGDSMAAISS